MRVLTTSSGKHTVTDVHEAILLAKLLANAEMGLALAGFAPLRATWLLLSLSCSLACCAVILFLVRKRDMFFSKSEIN